LSTSSSSDAATFAATPDGLTLAVRLAPRASANLVAGLVRAADGGLALKVLVTAPPEDGKANAALVALLAREWRLPKRAITLVAGAADRNKRLHIAADAAGRARIAAALAKVP
jgi:uncharacterized protein YggU (UPF0235/DUF167 family)